MTNADVPAIAVSHLGEVSNPFTEKVITPYNKKDGVKIITTLKWRVEDHGKFKFVYKPDELFLVKDNLFVEDNWIISE